MNIQLFLADREVELTEQVSVPINRFFQNLQNPTDIIADYSKSVKIPMTKKNNDILGHAYRLDKTILKGDGDNIGLYLDPTKKIPMQLKYNGSILLNGYAKFLSASIGKDKYYNLNLYGMIGDIFQKLLDVKPSELNDLITEYKTISKDSVYESFTKEWNYTGDDTSLRHWYDVIGFAPSYRGSYKDFESNKILTLGKNIPIQLTLGEYLTNVWTNVLIDRGVPREEAIKKAEAMDADSLIGDGLKDYQVGEYMSYEMKPYVYFNALMKMYQKKCKEITGYTLELDEKWFNNNNPYWSRMCYMLDFLANQDIKWGATMNLLTPILSNAFNPVDTSSTVTKETVPYLVKVGQESLEKNTDDPVLIESNTILVGERILDLRGEAYFRDSEPFEQGGKIEAGGTFTFNTNTAVNISVTYTNIATAEKKMVHYWWAKNPGMIDKTVYKIPTDAIFLNNVEEIQEELSDKYVTTYRFHIPEYEYNSSSVLFKGLYMPTVLETTEFRGNDSRAGAWLYTSSTGDTFVVSRGDRGYGKSIKFIPSFGEVSFKGSWKHSTKINLKNLYFDKKPLFEVILQYTKMFGLIWDIDYQNKVLKVLTRQTYFENYTIEDWTDKIDKNRECTIRPVAFESKNISFNYEKLDGMHYTGYRDKVGYEYGSLILNTGYEFNTKENKLYKGIYPSCISNKSFVTLEQMENLIDIYPKSIIPITDEVAFIDCEDKEGSQPIKATNWYLRDVNKAIPERYIVDAGPWMTENKKYCYLSKELLQEPIFQGLGRKFTSIPQFQVAINNPNSTEQEIVGCLFSTPEVDYTTDRKVSLANGHYIYDNCWKRYITERYNIQNKAITTYIRMSNLEFLQFRYNKFIVIDDQLYMVNKIFDFDLTSKDSVKCELVRVNDPKNYIEGQVTYPSVIFRDYNPATNSIEISPVDVAQTFFIGILANDIQSVSLQFEDPAVIFTNTLNRIDNRRGLTTSIYQGSAIPEGDYKATLTWVNSKGSHDTPVILHVK